jgi:hypothetical protein
LHFDGADDYLNGVWVQAQPVHRFAAALATETGTVTVSLFDGTTGNDGRVYTVNSGQGHAASAGVVLSDNTADPAVWNRVEAGFDGASSRLRIADRSPITGDAGAANPDGLTADCRIAEVIEYNRILTTAEQTLVHNYLASRWSL